MVWCFLVQAIMATSRWRCAFAVFSLTQFRATQICSVWIRFRWRFFGHAGAGPSSCSSRRCRCLGSWPRQPRQLVRPLSATASASAAVGPRTEQGPPSPGLPGQPSLRDIRRAFAGHCEGPRRHRLQIDRGLAHLVAQPARVLRPRCQLLPCVLVSWLAMPCSVHASRLLHACPWCGY